MSDKKINDPGLYRRLSEPFPDKEAANAALAAFFEAVGSLREQHKIPDVLVVCEISLLSEGDEIRGGARMFHGDSGNILPMVARVYGEERQAHEDNLARAVAAVRRKGSP